VHVQEALESPKRDSPSDLPWRQRPTKSLAKPGTVAIRSGASAISLDSRTKARAVAAKVKAHATRPWPEAGLLLLRNCFDPVECLLDPLTNAQADGIAAVPQAFVRQSQSYGRRCLCNVRRHFIERSSLTNFSALRALSTPGGIAVGW
jgi:hypothetical protein